MLVILISFFINSVHVHDFAYKCMCHLLSRISLILQKQTTISAIFSGLCGHHLSYFISPFKELEVYFPNIFIDLFVYS